MTILFFTLLKKIESDIVKKQITDILDDIFLNNEDTTIFSNVNLPKIYNFKNKVIDNFNIDIDILQKIQSNFKIYLKTKLNNIQSDTHNDNDIKINNEKIFKKSMLALLTINIICIFLLFALWSLNKYDIVYYLKKNLVLCVFVLLTELIFVYFITKKYVYIDKKYILLQLLNKK